MESKKVEELWKLSHEKSYTWQELCVLCMNITGLPTETFQRYFKMIARRKGRSGKTYRELDIMEPSTVFMVIGICLDLSKHKGIIKPHNVQLKLKEWSNYNDYFKEA